jgi:hypothetical protein
MRCIVRCKKLMHGPWRCNRYLTKTHTFVLKNEFELRNSFGTPNLFNRHSFFLCVGHMQAVISIRFGS